MKSWPTSSARVTAPAAAAASPAGRAAASARSGSRRRRRAHRARGRARGSRSRCSASQKSSRSTSRDREPEEDAPRRRRRATTSAARESARGTGAPYCPCRIRARAALGAPPARSSSRPTAPASATSARRSRSSRSSPALFGVLRGEPGDPDRDRFVLSKGHAALALYAALHACAAGSRREQLEHVLRRRQRCSARIPSTSWPASTSPPARSGTGSRSARARRWPPGCRAPSGGRSCSSATPSCNEGSLWEAAMFAAHHRLGEPRRDRRRERPAGARLHQATCSTSSRSASASRRSAGTRVEVDGHDVDALAARVSTRGGDRPRARGRAHDVRQGRLVHGGPGQVALLADVRRRLRAALLSRGRRMRKAFAEALVELAERGRARRAADRRPRLHRARAVRRALPRSLLQRRRRRAEHGRPGHRASPRPASCRSATRSRPSRRCAPYEFIRNGPVAHDLPVRIVGVGGGFDYGENGLTHYALEDVAVMRVQPRMTVLAPADDDQARAAVARDVRPPRTRLPARGQGGPAGARPRRALPRSAAPS